MEVTYAHNPPIDEDDVPLMDQGALAPLFDTTQEEIADGE